MPVCSIVIQHTPGKVFVWRQSCLLGNGNEACYGIVETQMHEMCGIGKGTQLFKSCCFKQLQQYSDAPVGKCLAVPFIGFKKEILRQRTQFLLGVPVCKGIIPVANPRVSITLMSLNKLR